MTRIAEKVRCACATMVRPERYHYRYVGMNSRLDTLQAAILLAKLDHFDDEVAARQAGRQPLR